MQKKQKQFTIQATLLAPSANALTPAAVNCNDKSAYTQTYQCQTTSQHNKQTKQSKKSIPGQ
jgi:hypothetical protein